MYYVHARTVIVLPIIMLYSVYIIKQVFNHDRESLVFSLLVVAEKSGFANSELSVVIWLGL